VRQGSPDSAPVARVPKNNPVGPRGGVRHPNQNGSKPGEKRHKPHFQVHQVAEALRRSAGVVSAAAQLLQQATGRGCQPQTVRTYLKRHPELAEEIQEAVEVNLDLAETKLLAAINNGNDWAVKFYLETKGKHRGYTRRQEIAGVASAPLVVTDARQWLTAELDGMDARLRSQSSGANGAAGQKGPPAAAEKTVH
jgi:hypothetical protein